MSIRIPKMSPWSKYRNKPHKVTFKYYQKLYNNLHNGKIILDESCFDDSGFESEVGYICKILLHLLGPFLSTSLRIFEDIGY